MMRRTIGLLTLMLLWACNVAGQVAPSAPGHWVHDSTFVPGHWVQDSTFAPGYWVPDSSFVPDTLPTPPPPPPPSGLSCSHEPTGLTPLTPVGWNALPTLNKLDPAPGAGWSTKSLSAMSLLTDPTVGNYLHTRFPTTLPGGASPYSIGITFPKPVTHLYSCFWLRVPAGFTNAGNAGTKLVYWWFGGKDHVYLSLFSGATDAGQMALNVQNPSCSGQPVCGGINSQGKLMLGSFAWPKHWGEWHQFETDATTSGAFTVWIDGVQTVARTGVLYAGMAPPPIPFSTVAVEPTYGGAKYAGPPATTQPRCCSPPTSLYLDIGPWRMSGK